MYNYRDKSNKYIGKLNILIGGQPITLRKSYIQLIILDIKERIYEYSKKFNSYTWEEQLIIWNNIYDNIDSTDDTIIDTIDEIDKYLPSFLLIWGGYYGYYENFPYYSVIDNIPEWKLPQRNPLKENVLLKLILENLKNKENLKKLQSEELLYPTYPYYEDPIIIKSSDSDDIIPISKFCRFNYSNIIGCYNKKCPKIHFPHPFSDHKKCHNDSNCRNYEKNMCLKFHTKQKQSLVFKKGLAHRRENLIGIKKLGLKHLQYRKENIIFNNGRIIFKDDIIQQIPINPLIHKISDIDIVNESNDFLNDNIQLSEKSFKVFAWHQIPVFMASPKQVETIRNIGFDMFDDIVDHSYDSAPNIHLHDMQVLNIVAKFLKAYPTLESVNQLRKKLYPRLKANNDLLYSLQTNRKYEPWPYYS
jgi:hypothetical protein